MSTYQLIKDLIKKLPEHNVRNYPASMGIVSLLKEYRTIGLRLPRQVGKSTAALTLHKNTSSYLYTKFPSTFDYEREVARHRGIKSSGLKLSALIFDEYDVVPEAAYYLVHSLAYSDLLAEDFFILHLYT